MDKKKEIEVKYLIGNSASAKKIVAKLKKIAAKRVKKINEEDVYFQVGKRNSLKTKECLRIRKVSRKKKRTEITYKPKSAKNEDGFFAKRELNLGVENFNDSLELLESLGHKRLVTVKKDRTYYRSGKCIISLDKLTQIGLYYLEIEIVGISSEKGLDLIYRLANKLDLGADKIEKKPYRDIILAYKRRLPDEKGYLRD